MKYATFLLLLSAAPAIAQQPVQPANPVIVTSGQGVVKRAPDRAWVAIAAESRARTAPEAQKLNVDAMTAVLDKIKSLGVPDEAIQTTAYTLQPDYEYQNGHAEPAGGYIARNRSRCASCAAGSARSRTPSAARRASAASASI